MESIKIAVFGADGFTCQVPRIKDGLKSLWHVFSEESPDLIYSNDPTGYQKAMELKKKFPKSHLMLNFLDVPWHIPNVEKQTNLLSKHFLDKADSVTVISYKVKKDLSKFLNKKIEVIYNPIKDIFYDKNIKKNNEFLYVGRANDPIKRISLVKESLLQINNSIKEIKICGSEDPGFGNYLGIISDNELNKIYNSSKYVLLPSKAEGIGLPMIEGMICGTIPITCSDNLTSKEFSLEDFICDPNAKSIVNKIQELDKDYEKKKQMSLEMGEKYKVQFDKKSIANNIIKTFLLK